MEESQVTQIFPVLFSDYVVPARPGRTLLGILDAEADEKVRVQAMQPAFSENPLFEHFLLKFSVITEKVAAWNEEASTVDETGKKIEGRIENDVLVGRILGLLGKQAVRNFACTLALSRAAARNLPKKPKDRFMLAPRDQIKHAIKAEEYCQDRNLIHPENAFRAGLHYDWLSASLGYKKFPKDEQTFLDNVFAEGMVTGRLAYDIGRRVKAVSYNEFIFAAGLVLPIGKALMSAVFPKSMPSGSYAGFLAECQQKGPFRREYFLLCEGRRFPVTHNELSSLYVSVFRFLRPIERAIAFYRDPYYLHADQKLHMLSTLLSVSSLIADHWAQLPSELPLQPFHRKWLQVVGLTEANLLEIAAKLKKGGG